MGQCPDTGSGVNCNYVGCCPWNEVCMEENERYDISDDVQCYDIMCSCGATSFTYDADTNNYVCGNCGYILTDEDKQKLLSSMWDDTHKE